MHRTDDPVARKRNSSGYHSRSHRGTSPVFSGPSVRKYKKSVYYTRQVRTSLYGSAHGITRVPVRSPSGKVRVVTRWPLPKYRHTVPVSVIRFTPLLTTTRNRGPVTGSARRSFPVSPARGPTDSHKSVQIPGSGQASAEEPASSGRRAVKSRPAGAKTGIGDPLALSRGPGEHHMRCRLPSCGRRGGRTPSTRRPLRTLRSSHTQSMSSCTGGRDPRPCVRPTTRWLWLDGTAPDGGAISTSGTRRRRGAVRRSYSSRGHS